MSKETAIYHQIQEEGDRVFDVLAKHKDGTVDLGTEASGVIVTNCKVNTDGSSAEGTCTIQAPAKEEKK